MSAVLSTAARPLLRRSALKLSAGRTAARRLESTGSTADKAKEVASKSSQGLSRVASAAGPALAGAAKGVSSAVGALSRIGGRTGRLIAFVERKGSPCRVCEKGLYEGKPRALWKKTGSRSRGAIMEPSC